MAYNLDRVNEDEADLRALRELEADLERSCETRRGGFCEGSQFDQDIDEMLASLEEQVQLDLALKASMKPVYKVSPKAVDIRNFKGKEYLDYLFGDEKELNVQFVTQKDMNKKSKAALKDPFPDFEVVDKAYFEDGPVESNSVHIMNAKNEREIDDLEATLRDLQDFPKSVDHAADDLPSVLFDSDEENYIDSESDEDIEKDEGDDFSEGTMESNEGGDEANMPSARAMAKDVKPKKTPVKGLKKLSLLSFLFARKKPGFKAKRDLRKELRSKGVNLNQFDSPRAKLSDVDKSINAFAAKRNLRQSLVKRGVDFNKI